MPYTTKLDIESRLGGSTWSDTAMPFDKDVTAYESNVDPGGTIYVRRPNGTWRMFTLDIEADPKEGLRGPMPQQLKSKWSAAAVNITLAQNALIDARTQLRYNGKTTREESHINIIQAAIELCKIEDEKLRMEHEYDEQAGDGADERDKIK